MSYNQIRQAISAALNPLDAQGRSTYRYYIRDVYPGGYAIAEDEQATKDSRYIRVDYTVNDKDQVVVGAQTKVKVEYVAVVESLRLMEAEAVGDTGLVWRVTLIRPGWSENEFYYSPEVLGAASALYEGVKAYGNHPSTTEMKDRPERAIQDVVGWYEGVRQEADGRLTAELHLLERSTWLGSDLKQKPTIYGLSHDVRGKTRIGEAAGRNGRLVEAIAEVKSVDVVTEAAAGGGVDQLIASNRSETREEDGTVEWTNVTIEQLKESRPDLVKAVEEAAKQAARADADPALSQLKESVTAVSTENKTLRQENQGLRESVASLGAETVITKKLTASNLPEPARVRVQALVEAAIPMKDGALDKAALETKLQEAIKAEQDYLTSVGGSPVKGAGDGGSNDTTVLEESLKAVDAAFDKAFGITVKEAK